MDKVWGALLLIMLVLIPSYSCYRLGRYLERKVLTTYLIQTLDDECEDCRIIGAKEAWRKFQQEYDTKPLESGRY